MNCPPKIIILGKKRRVEKRKNYREELTPSIIMTCISLFQFGIFCGFIEDFFLITTNISKKFIAFAGFFYNSKKKYWEYVHSFIGIHVFFSP